MEMERAMETVRKQGGTKSEILEHMPILEFFGARNPNLKRKSQYGQWFRRDGHFDGPEILPFMGNLPTIYGNKSRGNHVVGCSASIHFFESDAELSDLFRKKIKKNYYYFW